MQNNFHCCVILHLTNTTMYMWADGNSKEKWAATTKPTKWPVRPAKTLFSLGIHRVWSVFVVRMKKHWAFNYLLSAHGRLWSDWVDAQADLSLRWAHMSFCWRLKCREAAQMSAVHQVLTVILETFWNLTNLRGITLVSLRSSSVNLQPNEPAINENQMICNQMSWNQMRLWYSSNRQPAKAQASLRIRAVSPEPSLSTHMKYGSRWRVRPKIRHVAPLDGCACAFEELVYGGRKVPYSHEMAQIQPECFNDTKHIP